MYPQFDFRLYQIHNIAALSAQRDRADALYGAFVLKYEQRGDHHWRFVQLNVSRLEAVSVVSFDGVHGYTSAAAPTPYVLTRQQFFNLLAGNAVDLSKVIDMDDPRFIQSDEV